MALTQMQQIQSLGEALAWLEREISWGVSPASLTGLCGRIGELYACVLTNGQMAASTNQRGYDVVTAAGERVSIKTTTRRPPCSVPFTTNTLSLVDRIMVLRINTEEMQVEVLLDGPINVLRPGMRAGGQGKLRLNVPRPPAPENSSRVLRETRRAAHEGYTVVELENGTIQVWSAGEQITPAKPALRKLAATLGLSVKNPRGNDFNTRQLGSAVLEAITERWGHLPTMPLPPQGDHAFF